MLQNHEERVKKFILRMVESPIRLKTEQSKNELRGQFNLKHLKDKPMSFSRSTNHQDFSQSVSSVKHSKAEGETFTQPGMRFTYRCDLERVLDKVAGDVGFSARKKKLDQFLLIGKSSQVVSNTKKNTYRKNFFKPVSKQKPKPEDEDAHFYSYEDETKPSRRSSVYSIKGRKSAKPPNATGFNLHNSYVKGNLIRKILSKPKKLHFKSASVFAISTQQNVDLKGSTPNILSSKSENRLKLNRLYDQLNANSNNTNNGSQANQLPYKGRYYNHDYMKKKESKLKSSGSPARTGFTIEKYKAMAKNPFKELKRDILDRSFDSASQSEDTIELSKKLKYLEGIYKQPKVVQFEDKPGDNKNIKATSYYRDKLIPFLKANKEFSVGLLNDPLSFFKGKARKQDDPDFVCIDNISYHKSMVKTIAQKVLLKCNYTHSKNKSMKGLIRKGDGKMMFSNGLTVREFCKRYNLK